MYQYLQTQQTRPPSTSNAPMEAMIATPETLFDPNWYPDSGASNHVTNTSINLQLQQQYDGGEKVYIGNGHGLSIPNIGESYILANKDAILLLKNLLHVPSITKNLPSVSKLAKDNNIFFEFYANEVFVKCQETKEILLKGTSKAEIQTLVHKLHSVFALKDIGHVHFFLGIKVNYLRDGSMLLTQTKYMRDLLLKVGMSTSKLVDTPLISSLKLTKEGADLMANPQL
ncbi:Retrovirus-related Pol polyprotein from transposon TNT 1-94 [Senna tora]|uniref:Retrovirus-related Pol polyprotein from transposon TNT 1-94 n=1 Tax=Senna tora TaxID=362788 RepID=A0A834WZJ3_9FABA|nr:Retrovirus-related Pol polyprotein from transposon TNT 1-94 [Senna tora]